MSSGDQPGSRKYQGRQKTEMKKIENEKNRKVTFSKRRAGVFNKSGELCTLTGAEAAIVVFSPSNKPHCFGDPDVRTVSDKYLGSDNHFIEGQGNSNQSNQAKLNHLSLVETVLEEKKKLAKRQVEEQKMWGPSGSMDELDSQQVDKLSGTVAEFGVNVEEKEMDAMMLSENGVPGMNFGGCEVLLDPCMDNIYQDYGSLFLNDDHANIVPNDQFGNTNVTSSHDQQGTSGASGEVMPDQINKGKSPAFF